MEQRARRTTKPKAKRKVVNRLKKAGTKTGAKNNKKLLLKALESTLGNISEACKQVGVSRNLYYKFKKSDPDWAKEVENVFEANLDFAENQLLSLVKDKNPTAIIFLLKTRGKERGYVERSELTGPNGGAIELKDSVSPKSAFDILESVRSRIGSESESN